MFALGRYCAFCAVFFNSLLTPAILHAPEAPAGNAAIPSDTFTFTHGQIWIRGSPQFRWGMLGGWTALIIYVTLAREDSVRKVALGYTNADSAIANSGFMLT